MSERPTLEGSMVAMVTPFAGGKVDYDALGRLIDFQIAGGTQGLVPCGTTGESPTLDYDEHDKVIEFIVQRTAGSVPVIAGTGSNSTAEALDLTRHAKSCGADACLIVNPYYNKPTQHGHVEHVARIAEIGLPIVLYNIPSRCGVAMTVGDHRPDVRTRSSGSSRSRRPPAGWTSPARSPPVATSRSCPATIR